MEFDFDRLVNEEKNKLFACVERRFEEEDVERVYRAYELAEEAHRPQRRKSGEP